MGEDSRVYWVGVFVYGFKFLGEDMRLELSKNFTILIWGDYGVIKEFRVVCVC